jgi:chemotaxis protein MotB
VLFDSGKANLKDEAVEILSKITVAIRTYEQSIQMIRIEGHTDNVPINTAEFPSNWELSTARAVTVLKFLIQNQNLSPEMLSAVGYGEYHNIAGNDTAEGRAKNRRVDFVIARSADKNTAQ